MCRGNAPVCFSETSEVTSVFSRPFPAACGASTAAESGHGAHHHVAGSGVRHVGIGERGSYHYSAAPALQPQRHFPGTNSCALKIARFVPLCHSTRAEMQSGAIKANAREASDGVSIEPEHCQSIQTCFCRDAFTSPIQNTVLQFAYLAAAYDKKF